MSEVRQRSGAYIGLQKLESKVATLDPDNTPIGDIKNLIQETDMKWARLEDLHFKILATCSDDAAISLQLTTLEPMEECYRKIKNKLSELHLRISSFTTSTSTANVKLPEMSLPSFDGKYENWTQFEDMFKATIHNHKTLSASQKLQYLKSCVKGDATNLIKSFTVSDANYQEAWNLLEARYNNKREIVFSLLKKLTYQPVMKTESAVQLQSLIDTTLETLTCLKVLGLPTDKWDELIVFIISDKMDGVSKAEWSRTFKGTDIPTVKELHSFIEQHIRTLHARGTMTNTAVSSKPSADRHKFTRNISTHHSAISNCKVCKNSHQVYQCTKLREMTPSDRLATIKSAGLCINCLREGHSSRECSSQFTCRKCKKKHNTLLHTDGPHWSNSQQQVNHQPGNSGSNNQVGIHTTAVHTSETATLLKTAVVDVKDSNNVKHPVRVFIDDGGEGGLIRESCLESLGLKKQRTDVTISGVAGAMASRAKWKTKVRLFSQFSDDFIDVELYAVPKVTGSINRLQSTHHISWTHIKGLQLADPLYYKGGEVDILLGADTAPYLIKSGFRKAGRQAPCAQNTIFGWVLWGNVSEISLEQPLRIHSFNSEISTTLRKFWEIEELPQQHALTPEEKKCEAHFISTHSRKEDGRFIVRLPFNDKKMQLGESKTQAIYRMQSLERRFKQNPQYKAAYISFMQEYENMGHMSKVSPPSSEVKTYYLPHHFVLKEDSTTTKQRTVFDGSAKTKTGVSLNDTLLVGATVQTDLYTLLLRFRYNVIALKADIAKMYRQFLVHEDDRNYQMILWREDATQPMQHYQLNTVTYGTASAPFCATRCLNQLAVDENEKFPGASKALLSSCYVDDYLGTSESVEKAKCLVKELIGITACGGMEIRKWCSNDPAVLQSIPEELRELNPVSFEDESGTVIKALGIKWNPITDMFEFSVKLNISKIVTKRLILSEVSKTFDPLGWLSPVTVNGKLLLQVVWLQKYDWDDRVSEDLHERWLEYLDNLIQIEQVKVPRCLINKKVKFIELHGFSDSSEAAYSSAVYVKGVYDSGEISVNLLTSRTKIAPLKQVSLPKLELAGAKLLSDTIEAVRKTFDKPFSLFCWTDSTITLRWISSHSRRWKTYVANRVSAIQSSVAPEHWRHVKSNDNPADLPSRGISTVELTSSHLWWHGPDWLHNPESNGISSSFYRQHISGAMEYNEEDLKREEKAKQMAVYHLSNNSVHTTLFGAFSSFQKLCRAAAYYRKFILFLKNKKTLISSKQLTVEEISTAKRCLIKWAQEVSFPSETHNLRKMTTISSSKLAQFTPFIDKHGLLRVGGRIQRAHVPEETKHPVILPHNHLITTLIIRDTHLKNLHSGFSLTFATLKQQYLIIRGRTTIRNLIRKCVICRRARATTANQLMGNLPVSRVIAAKPFHSAGVDFAGPFAVKMKVGRHVPVEKTYFAIFVCMATKAVHLEAVMNLTSESFIAAFERFISRRGPCAQLFSDNATNFVGGGRILKTFLVDEQERFTKTFSNHGVQWTFNPPSAPHQGGLWEAGVKAVKTHFYKVVGQSTLKFDQFQTLLAKIEACLNSRPLTALSSDPNDLDALTPGHFLVGGPLNSIPEPDMSDVPPNRLTHWELVRNLSQRFWKRWHAEYLTSLQQRFKWTQRRENLQVGDLVVIADDILPLTKWKLGRVMETHPGADGLVRSVTLKTAGGSLTRPIHKLSPLINVNE